MLVRKFSFLVGRKTHTRPLLRSRLFSTDGPDKKNEGEDAAQPFDKKDTDKKSLKSFLQNISESQKDGMTEGFWDKLAKLNKDASQQQSSKWKSSKVSVDKESISEEKVKFEPLPVPQVGNDTDGDIDTEVEIIEEKPKRKKSIPKSLIPLGEEKNVIENEQGNRIYNSRRPPPPTRTSRGGISGRGKGKRRKGRSGGDFDDGSGQLNAAFKDFGDEDNDLEADSTDEEDDSKIEQLEQIMSDINMTDEQKRQELSKLGYHTKLGRGGNNNGNNNNEEENDDDEEEEIDEDMEEIMNEVMSFEEHDNDEISTNNTFIDDFDILGSDNLSYNIEKAKNPLGDERVMDEDGMIMQAFMKGLEPYAGYNIDKSGMDPIDCMLADIFTHASTSSTHSFTTANKTKEFNRTRLPKARNLADMLMSIQPKIPKKVTDEFAQSLIVQSMKVLMKNNSFSDEQKHYIACRIGERAQYIITMQKEYEIYEAKRLAEEERPFYDIKLGKQDNTNTSDNTKKVTKKSKKLTKKEALFEAAFDLTNNPNFRRGLRFMESEKDRMLLERAKPKDDFNLGETDWEAQAVVNEDDLVFEEDTTMKSHNTTTPAAPATSNTKVKNKK